MHQIYIPVQATIVVILMALYKCTNCGNEEELEIHQQPEKCPYCKATVEDTQDLWEEME